MFVWQFAFSDATFAALRHSLKIVPFSTNRLIVCSCLIISKVWGRLIIVNNGRIFSTGNFLKTEHC